MKKYSTCYLLILCVLSVILSSCSSQPHNPVSVVNKYLYVTKWENRLQYIRNSDKVKPLMAEFYKDFKPLKQKDILSVKKINENGDWTTVLVEFANHQTHPYFIQKKDSEYKIDWESSVPYQPMSIEEFKATHPTQPVKFRLVVQLDDYYNFEFDDLRDKYWSIQLYVVNFDDPMGRTLTGLNGFIDKNSEDGKKLFDLVKDGKEHAVVMEIMYPEGSDPDNNCVLISSLVSDTIFEN